MTCDPPRWRDEASSNRNRRPRPPAGEPIASIGAMLARVPEPRPLSPREVATLRLMNGRRPSVGRPNTPRRRAAIGGGVVVLALGGVLGWRATFPVSGKGEMAPNGGGAVGAEAALQPQRHSWEVPPVPSATAPVSHVQPPHAPARQPVLARVTSRRLPASPPPAPTSMIGQRRLVLGQPARSRLAEEASEIAATLRLLRQDRDPGGALANLVIYRLRFPQGALAAEARALGIEANLATHRVTEALALLDLRSVAELPRSTELSLLRAELLTEAGQCPSAMEAFDRVLSSPFGGLRERALIGRASCRASAGDSAGSRADFETYLAEFPSGRYAPSIRVELGKVTVE